MNQNQTTCLCSIKYKPDYTGRQKCPDGRAQTCFTKALLVSEGRKLYLFNKKRKKKEMHTCPFSELSGLIPPSFSTSVLICVLNERSLIFFFCTFMHFYYCNLQAETEQLVLIC